MSIWLCLSPQDDSTAPKRAPKFWFPGLTCSWGTAEVLPGCRSCQKLRGRDLEEVAELAAGQGRYGLQRKELQPTDANPYPEGLAAWPAC